MAGERRSCSGATTAVVLLVLLAARQCLAEGPLNPPLWASSVAPGPAKELYTTMSKLPGSGFRVYHNVWWHGYRFYAVLPHNVVTDPLYLDDGLSVAHLLTRMAVTDVEALLNTTRIAYVRGATLLVDYPFQTLAEHFSHWAEIMVPTYSVLKEGKWGGLIRRGTPDPHQRKWITDGEPWIDHLLMTNLNRDLNPWFKAALRVAVAPGVQVIGEEFPNFIDFAETYKYDKLSWIMFENIIAIDDRYTHPQGNRGFISADHGDLWRFDGCHRWVSPSVATRFATPSHGAAFREAMWAQVPHVGRPAPWVPGQAPPLPRTITLLLPTQGEWAGIVNTDKLKAALEEVAAEHGMEARVVTVSKDASLGTHLDAAASTGVLVGRHGPIMANAMLLPPGAMVLELLPYKWEWAKLSLLHYNITQSMGDIHHFAWRPTHHKWAKFANYSDVRYYPWTPEECESYECLNKLRNAELIADIPAVIGLLRSKLPKVLQGAAVSELQEPWPKTV